jgi:hypothetical protein
VRIGASRLIEDEQFMRKSKANTGLIPMLVDEGLSDVEIAKRMGWTVGTLRVRCSRLKISLKRKTPNRGQIVLPRRIFDQLQHRAAMMGVTTSALAGELLEVIARDGLYNAVLDSDDADATRRNALVN